MFIFLTMISFVAFSCSEEETVVSKYPVPTITSFSPSQGFPTSIVTISGTEFGNERTERIGRVYFGGVEATEYVSWSNNEIKVRVPETAKSGNITLWVSKNFTETESEFTCIPGAVFTGINPNPVFPGNTIVLTGKNLDFYLDNGVQPSDITVSFCAEEGKIEATAKELTATTLSVVVPMGAKTGALTIDLAGYQTVTSPELNIVGDVKFSFMDYLESGGTVTIKDTGIDSTKDGAWVIYKITPPASGLYEIYSYAGTQKDGSSINININKNLDALKVQPLDDRLTQAIPKGAWGDRNKGIYGPFYMNEGDEYYVKVLFKTTSGSWVANLHELGITLCADQSKTPVNSQTDQNVDYVIYQNNFNSGSSYYPFVASWAWEPNYIEVKDQCLEFYYNYEALKNDDRRMRKGAEITCDFHTTTEGWYGFKFFLPEGKFPMTEDGIIIAQIFNKGCKNSWAGNLVINSGKLQLYHRHALIDPVVGTVATNLETNKWYSVVLYFKVGRDNGGSLKAWIGDNMVENSPIYDSGDCRFGYGHWIDNNTLDDTGNNPDCAGYNGEYDALGCKFGLYVQNQVDITIRMDEIKALQGNPSGAFNIVKPSGN